MTASTARNLVALALEAGLPASSVWTMTPAAFRAAIEAAHRRRAN